MEHGNIFLILYHVSDTILGLGMNKSKVISESDKLTERNKQGGGDET